MLFKWFRYIRNKSKYYKLFILAIKRGEIYKSINLVGIIVAYFFKLKKVPFLPATIDIEPNNNCNLRCEHCQVSHWTKDIRYLDIKSYRYILNQFPYLLSAKLQGMGEPFLNRQLPFMLKEGEERGISMLVFTNGTIYDEHLAKKLIQLKNTHICFSIDGATPEIHEKIRKGSNFEKILRNIGDLANHRGLNIYPRLSIWSVITKNNIHEATQIVKLSKLLSVDSIYLQTTLVNWGKNNIDRYNKTIRIDLKSKEFDYIWLEAKNAAEKEKIILEIMSTGFSRKNKCYWPWTSAYIAANGDVIPCCNIADSHTLKMGNLFETSFSDIWNSREYMVLRERIRTHNIPEFCKSCYFE
ncbi:Antilisterial bacteriocin subtilosin biosynthesis protein AlbA [Methanosarcinales archaeon]|nr:MAG: radical SAM protein [Candidatus Methanoperedens sp.]CAG0998536.1 Antilisterial bacteriocin subtilosin biosynthesis protein AlbA [Methanosarcinales archaeon]